MSSLQLKTETIMLKEISYLIQSLKDRQQYDEDDLVAINLGISPATWPLFGIVWPSSIVLASTVAAIELGNSRVLEIGCGLAFCSIVLHSMGVNITASDYHPSVPRFLDRNVRHNNLPPLPYETGNWESSNPTLGEFDLIIGSDVLYEPDHSNTVARFIDRHAAADARVIIVDPGRRNKSSFTRNMRIRGYSHHREPFTHGDENETLTRGHILRYQRNRSTHEIDPKYSPKKPILKTVPNKLLSSYA